MKKKSFFVLLYAILIITMSSTFTFETTDLAPTQCINTPWPKQCSQVDDGKKYYWDTQFWAVGSSWQEWINSGRDAWTQLKVYDKRKGAGADKWYGDSGFIKFCKYENKAYPILGVVENQTWWGSSSIKGQQVGEGKKNVFEYYGQYGMVDSYQVQEKRDQATVKTLLSCLQACLLKRCRSWWNITQEKVNKQKDWNQVKTENNSKEEKKQDNKEEKKQTVRKVQINLKKQKDVVQNKGKVEQEKKDVVEDKKKSGQQKKNGGS